MSLDITFTEIRPTDVHSQNITHNLNRMAEAAGIYQCLWRPEECVPPITKARELAVLLAPAIADMKARSPHYMRFNAENGWGTFDQLVPWLEKLYAACMEHPDADISVSR